MQSRRRRQTRPSTFLTFGLLAAVLVFGSHALLLTTPWFWDEAGSTIPAAFEIHDTGQWTTPHAVPLYIAAVWKLTGPSLPAARCAMLLLASLTLLGAFVLAVELCGALRGVPAFAAAALLAVSPLFFTQAILATPAIPLTFCAVYALWLALSRRYVLAALAAALFLLVLAWSAPLFSLSAAILSHPIQLSIVLARRLYFLFIANLHLLGLAGIALAWRAGSLRRRRWAIAGAFSLAWLILSCFRTHILERDLLPILPIFYTAAIVGFHSLSPKLNVLATGALIAGLISGLFINPPFWPFPYENNLALADFTRLQQQTANWLSEKAPHKAIATAWPLSDALTRPRLGYVGRRLLVLRLPDLSAETVQQIPKDTIDIFVRYSRDWDPPRTLLTNKYVRYAARYYFGYRPTASPEEIEQRLGLHLLMAWERGGQWVELYGR
ncbi:MAG: hypothetical protein HY858_06845 [Candidatus Solibacter usitatus]|nr:hypothetical protein [Candidatus Solibacter usitatus]